MSADRARPSPHPPTALRALALVLLALAVLGCAEEASDRSGLPAWAKLSDAEAGRARLALVMVTDYSTGGLSVLDLETRSVAPLVALTHSDAVARYRQGRVYVVNRWGQDNIQILDEGYSTVGQFSVGNGSNPQDIVFLDDASEALISRYAQDPLRVRLEDGEALEVLDLGDLRGRDSIAETAYMVRSGERVLIAAQRLEDFVPGPEGSAVLSYDPQSGAVQEHRIEASNPLTELVTDPCGEGFLVGGAGRFGALDGGIEQLSPAGDSLGILIPEEDLGGDILSFVVSERGELGYAIVSLSESEQGPADTALVRFDGCEAGDVEVVDRPGGFVLQHLALTAAGELLVADRSPESPGLRVYDAATGEPLAQEALPTGLPPFQILLAP